MAGGMDLETFRIPVYCTTNLSREDLECFLNSTRARTEFTSETEHEKGYSVPTLLTSTSYKDALKPRPDPPSTWLNPFISTGSPFVGWSPLDLFAHFSSPTLGPSADPTTSELWSTGTFGILDADSRDFILSPEEGPAPARRTIVIASHLPDWKEGRSVYLKTCRVKFEDFAGEVCRLETFITRPSELGKDTALSFSPPLIFDQGGMPAIVQKVSYSGVENTHPYSKAHLEMQGRDWHTGRPREGCVRYLISAAPEQVDGEADGGTGGR